jgi:hypothetical protein
MAFLPSNASIKALRAAQLILICRSGIAVKANLIMIIIIINNNHNQVGFHCSASVEKNNFKLSSVKNFGLTIKIYVKAILAYLMF